MNLTAREMTVLRTLWNNTLTTQEIAAQLDISYDVCVKEVRNLMRQGYVQEMPFRKGKQRLLTATSIPGKLEDLPPVDKVLVLWNGKLMPIVEAINSFSGNSSISIRYRILQLLAALEQRGIDLAEEGESASGWTTRDIRIAFRKTLSEINTWQLFIEELLKLPIWNDSPELAEKLGITIPAEQRLEVARLAEQHFMASGKRALDS